MERAVREEVLSHVHEIFRAFVARDRERIRQLHREDWLGFLGASTHIERGIDDYMRHVELSLDNYHGVGYEILESEVRVHGEVALVYYVARYDYRTPAGEAGSLLLRALDVYRRDASGWNQAGSHIGVVPRVESGRWGPDG